MFGASQEHTQGAHRLQYSVAAGRVHGLRTADGEGLGASKGERRSTRRSAGGDAGPRVVRARVEGTSASGGGRRCRGRLHSLPERRVKVLALST